MTSKYSESSIHNIFNSDTNDSIFLQNKFETISSIITKVANLLYNGQLKTDEPFIRKFQKKINTECNINLSKKQIYKIIKATLQKKEDLFSLITESEIPDELQKYYYDLNTLSGGGDDEITHDEVAKWRNYKPTFVNKIFGWEPDTKFFPTKILDVLQLILDLAGFIPGIGEIPDGIALVMNLIRKRFLNAFFNVIDLIPLVGSFIGVPGKFITTFIKYEKKLKKLKEFEELALGVSGPAMNEGAPPYQEQNTNEQLQQPYQQQPYQQQPYQQQPYQQQPYQQQPYQQQPYQQQPYKQQ